MISLFITGTPNIAAFPTSQTVALYSQLTLICTATGFPTPMITWRRNGTNYTSSNSQNISVMQPTDALIISKIVIDSVMWRDAGFYECVANNSLGSAFRNATVTVGGMYVIHSQLYL